MAWLEGVFLDVYPWSLALHLISVISWMAGLLYLPRLFVYHVEKSQDHPNLHIVFQEMEKKLSRLIMNPAMISAWISGLVLVLTPGIVDWSAGWPWVKAAMVLSLTWYHHLLARWRKGFATGRNTHSGRFYRMMNEIPAVLMIVIVLMVVARPF